MTRRRRRVARSFGRPSEDLVRAFARQHEDRLMDAWDMLHPDEDCEDGEVLPPSCGEGKPTPETEW